MTNVEESKSKENLNENILVITIDQNALKTANAAETDLVNDSAANSLEQLSPEGKTTASSSSTSSASSFVNHTSEAAPLSTTNDATSAGPEDNANLNTVTVNGAANDAQEAEYVESDDHLPRVQEELDTLNYANEAINNLELELEECKREHVVLVEESEEKLKVLEKKLGSCVSKCRQYYELRPEVEDLKAKYLKAKHRFETAQELYVAAKNMQMYAEENLENFEIKLNEASDTNETDSNMISQVDTSSNDVFNISYASSSLSKRKTQHLNDGDGKEMLTRILEDAKKKVIETESSKQINDQLQIDSFLVYSQKLKTYELMEKDLRRSIEKSREYYDLKAELDKEINFSSAKVEGLKSCLKEAKLTYHQALKNLERISTEIHTQRQTMNISSAAPLSESFAATSQETKSVDNAESDDKKSSSYDTSNSSSSLIYQNADSSLNNRLFSMNDSFSQLTETMNDLDLKNGGKAASFENSKLTLFNNKSSNSDLDLAANDSEEAEHEDFDQYFKNSTVKSPTNSLFTNLDSKSPLETSENSSPSNTKESSPAGSKKEQTAQVSNRPQFRLPALLLRSHPK